MSNIIFTEGTGVANSIYGKSQEPIKMFLEQRGEEFEQNSQLKALFNMNTSKNWGDKYTSMTGMRGFKPVGQNGAHPSDGFQEGYSKFIEYMTWKDSFSISREMIDDSRMLDLKQQPAAFITGYYRTRERFGAAIWGGAMSGKSVITFEDEKFDVTCADGGPVFNKTHKPLISGSNQSNLFSNPFSVDALGLAETAMHHFKGENGELLNVAPDTIVIGDDAKLKKDIFAAIGADKDPVTANNAFNYQYGRWSVIVWPYLDEFIASKQHPWILLDSKFNENYYGSIWTDRVSLEVTSSTDRNTNANIWDGYARFNAGFNDWRFAAIGGVSGGTELS